MSRIHDVLDELGVPVDAQLFELALTHRSWAYENGGGPTNERLEFLGNSVLGVVVTEHIYRMYPSRSEGELAKLRAAVVNAHSLADVATSLDLGPLILLGKGEVATNGHKKVSILADTMESVIGAVHLTGGIDASTTFVHHLFDPVVARAADLGAGLDWKTSLQELCADSGLGVPGYAITESGPDHDKRFEAFVVLGDARLGPGVGMSKKQAEQQAAGLAFAELAAHRAGSAPDA